MMFKLTWTERGQREFHSALAYIAEESPAGAQAIKDRVAKSLVHLESFSLGLPAPKGTHKLYVPKTPYFLIFRRDDDGDISICAFVHASRDWELIDWEQL